MDELYDILILGSGAAGLTFAMEAAKSLKVAICTKDSVTESNTRYAQGGIAAVLRMDDDYQKHFDDTMEAGDGICNRQALKVLVYEAPARIRDLMRIGVQFDRDRQDQLQFGREGGHSKSRVLHVGDMTGKAIEEALVSAVVNNPNVSIFDHLMGVDIITGQNMVIGAVLIDQQGNLHRKFAKAILLATGGAGQLYNRTTNPPIATGDGFAMASNAGAQLADMEFIQFHPTAFYMKDAPTFLISEALRGEGAILVNQAGERFMEQYHESGELAPRDIVSRAIYDQMKKEGSEHVWLDISHKDPEYLRKRFPYIYSQCLKYGVDITKDKIPVSPAAHYICGGVVTDIDGKTQVPGLYACGEVACTGVHGANRLASNSLLESVVFAYRAAVHVEKYIAYLPSEWNKLYEQSRNRPLNLDDNKKECAESQIRSYRTRLQDLMWKHAGIVRTNIGLAEASYSVLEMLETVQGWCKKFKLSTSLLELRNLISTAKSVLYFCRMRKANIGTHFNSDLEK